MREHSVNILNVGGHKLDRTPIHVDGGDKINFGGNGQVFFPKSPFKEGSGPFGPGSVCTVLKGQLERDSHFPCSLTEGEIIVDNPD